MLNSTIKQKQLDKAIKDLGQQVEEIRHNFIAHLNLLQHTDPASSRLNEKPLVLSELEQYQRTVNDYFELLCFSNFRGLLPWEYTTDDGKDEIDDILLNVARHSTLINAPERNPYLWPGIRDSLTEKQLEILNKYRSKLGLSSV